MAANSQFSMAVHILAMLAQSTDGNVKSECIAGSVNTNAVVIRRLLGQLSSANLVESRTGAHGGARLARRPDEISLAEIYKAVPCGGVFALLPNVPNQDCPVGRNIESILCNLQKDINKSVCDKLSRITLQDILKIIEQGRN